MSRREAPMIARLEYIEMDVSPEMAAQWLEGKCPNRNVSEQVVRRYAEDMLAGAWHLNGETIVFSKDGGLLDGQHRLWAVVESGMTVKMSVVRGADQASMTTYDMGRARTFADALAIQGESHSREVASGARLVHWYDTRKHSRTSNSHNPTHRALQEVVSEHPMIRQAARVVANTQSYKILQKSVAVFVTTFATERDSAKAEEWNELLARGSDIGRGHPVYTLREKLIAVKMNPSIRLDPITLMAFGVKSWNYFYRNRSLTALRWGGMTNRGVPEEFPSFED